MVLTLLVVLAAAPLDVVVINASGKDAARARAMFDKKLSGETQIDATALRTYLNGSGMVIKQDFDAFKARPQASWPPQLAGEWEKDLAVCRKIGPPPWREEMIQVAACADRLSMVLWQTYLNDLRPRRVFEFSVAFDDKKKESTVSATTYEPAGTQSNGLTETVPAADTQAAIDRIVTSITGLAGGPKPREVVNEMESAPVGDPLAGQAVATTPLALKKSCDGLPSALEVTPDGVLSQSVVARWKASVKSTAPKAACTLELTRHDELLFGVQQQILTAVLKCGDKSVRDEVAVHAAKPTPETLAGKLITGLAVRYCK